MARVLRWTVWMAAAGLALATLPVLAAAPAMEPAPAAGSAVSPQAQATVRAALARLSSQVEIDTITSAPLPGFYQVLASGQLLYVSADGRYIFNGELYDLTTRRNESAAAWAAFRQRQLPKVPIAARIVYAPKAPRYTVTVFTDVNCSFCRALHAHMAEFNAAGIAVEYLAWPREGLTTTSGRPTPTYTQMESVWCAADRKAAFAAAVRDEVKPATCANPVADQFNLGVKLGVSGTPTIIGPDGRVLGGYLTPAQLLTALRMGD